jgi:predicted RNase H-like nuclease
VVVLIRRDDPSYCRVRAVAGFAEVLEMAEQPSAIAIDIPIGLPEVAGPGGRPADIAARGRLGARRSSVFPVPARAVLAERDYGMARRVALACSEPPRSLQKQCFNLFPRMREVDALMSPALQERVYECHPELAFWALNGGRPLAEPKKLRSRPHAPGLDLRRGLLANAGLPARLPSCEPISGIRPGADDLLDAAACAWTARRIALGRAVRLPSEPDRDVRGLRMEIWA